MPAGKGAGETLIQAGEQGREADLRRGRVVEARRPGPRDDGAAAPDGDFGAELDGALPDVHHRRAANLLRDGELPSLDALLGDFRAEEHGYPAAGSFCGFMLETRGLDAFRRLYPVSDLRTAARAVLDEDIEAVDTAWRAFLESRTDEDGG